MKMLVYWIGAALAGYVVLVLPVVLFCWLVLGWQGSAFNLFAFAYGMIVGGLAPIAGLGSERVQRWIDR